MRWRTAVPTTSTVRHGEISGALDSVTSEATPTTDHDVLLAGLSHGSKLYYRIEGDGEVRSPELSFYALPHPRWRRFDLTIVGSSGTGEPAQHELGERMREKRPELWLHLGDLV